VYDAIVIGARCGGAPLAMLLARQGHRVLVVDRNEFPSDTISTHYVKRTGAALLRDWGLLGDVEAIGTPRIRNLVMRLDDVSLSGQAPAYRGIDADYTPRRLYLDKILVDRARADGAEIRERFTVRELVFDADRVVGIRGDEKGTLVEERARVVVGADGMNSLVARSLGARTYYDTGSLTCAHYAYFSGIRDRHDLGRLYVLGDARRFIITFPTNDDLDMVFVFWPKEEASRVRGDLDGEFHQALGLVPELGERVRSGRRETKYRGMNSLPNFFREAHGPGWALIGDAALHRDPITAQGITNAFTHAQLLAEELGAAFAGEKPLHLALSSYDQRQVEQLKPMFDYTVHLAQLEPPSAGARKMLMALAQDQGTVDAFLGAFIGSVQLKDVFPAEMIEGFSRTVTRLASAQEKIRDVARAVARCR